VEPEIRDKVLEAVERHNYRPDARARSLRSKTTGLVGLAIKRPHPGLDGDPFYTSLISELLDGLSATPYRLTLQSIREDESQWSVYDALLRTRAVDGLILIESEANDERLVRLQRDQFPFVLIGNPMDSRVWSVDNDNVTAGETATQHLYDSGYRRIGYLGGHPGLTVSEDRLEGYLRVVGRHGLEPLVWRSEFGWDAAREKSAEILGGPAPPDALVVLDDYMAMGVVVAARRAGIRIPQELGLVGFNDSVVCDMVEVGLTSVSLDIPCLVRTALTTLLSLIAQEDLGEPTRVIVPSVLKVRGSSIRAGGLL
jgi:DNA-binding LacI/PurR family transcriptional regulator